MHVQDALVRSLVNRFKEFRRPKKLRDRPCEKKTILSRVGKAPGITNSLKQPVSLPVMRLGIRHTKALQVEFKKTNRNCALIGDLMERSFAMRRMEILENNYSLNILYSVLSGQPVFRCS